MGRRASSRRRRTRPSSTSDGRRSSGRSTTGNRSLRRLRPRRERLGVDGEPGGAGGFETIYIIRGRLVQHVRAGDAMDAPPAAEDGDEVLGGRRRARDGGGFGPDGWSNDVGFRCVVSAEDVERDARFRDALAKLGGRDPLRVLFQVRPALAALSVPEARRAARPRPRRSTSARGAGAHRGGCSEPRGRERPERSLTRRTRSARRSRAGSSIRTSVSASTSSADAALLDRIVAASRGPGRRRSCSRSGPGSAGSDGAPARDGRAGRRRRDRSRSRPACSREVAALARPRAASSRTSMARKGRIAAEARVGPRARRVARREARGFEVVSNLPVRHLEPVPRQPDVRARAAASRHADAADRVRGRARGEARRRRSTRRCPCSRATFFDGEAGVRRSARHAFFPQPDVDSAVVTLVPKPPQRTSTPTRSRGSCRSCSRAAARR